MNLTPVYLCFVMVVNATFNYFGCIVAVMG